jgi:hypothetical protein
VLLGRWRGAYLQNDGPEHVLCFAPTRSGKGVGLVVPTLLTSPGSAIVHDIKGENWSPTAGWRAGFGCVLMFDPTISTFRMGAGAKCLATNAIAGTLLDISESQRTPLPYPGRGATPKGGPMRPFIPKPIHTSMTYCIKLGGAEPLAKDCATLVAASASCDRDHCLAVIAVWAMAVPFALVRRRGPQRP